MRNFLAGEKELDPCCSQSPPTGRDGVAGVQTVMSSTTTCRTSALGKALRELKEVMGASGSLLRYVPVPLDLPMPPQHRFPRHVTSRRRTCD